MKTTRDWKDSSVPKTFFIPAEILGSVLSTHMAVYNQQ